MTTGLADFFKQNLWANLCLLDACANLTDVQLDGSFRKLICEVLEVR